MKCSQTTPAKQLQYPKQPSPKGFSIMPMKKVETSSKILLLPSSYTAQPNCWVTATNELTRRSQGYQHNAPWWVGGRYVSFKFLSEADMSLDIYQFSALETP